MCNNCIIALLWALIGTYKARRNGIAFKQLYIQIITLHFSDVPVFSSLAYVKLNKTFKQKKVYEK